MRVYVSDARPYYSHVVRERLLQNSLYIHSVPLKHMHTNTQDGVLPNLKGMI